MKKHDMTPVTLAEQVSKTLEQYFTDLDGQETTDLYEMVLQQVEKPLLEFVLERTENNQSQSAQIVGINRNTLRKKMLKYQLIDA